MRGSFGLVPLCGSTKGLWFHQGFALALTLVLALVLALAYIFL